MRREDISNAVGDIAERHVTEAARAGETRRRPRRAAWMGAAAAVLAAAVLFGALFWPGGGTMKTYAIAQAQYPKMAPYPSNEWNEGAHDKWWESRRAQRDQPEGYGEGLEGFYAAAMAEFLSGAEGENKVCSPLNIYMALGMLAELTDGESREQILDLVGAESIEGLRAQTSALWNANYCDDGAVTSVLASSLWLGEGVRFKQRTMDTLARTYYASSYKGEMGSAGFNKALQDWLNEQTHGLLKEQAGQIELTPETILALATTLYFNAKWGDEFNKDRTTQEVFHAPGGDVTRDFMHQGTETNYYWGEKFGAVRRYFEAGSASAMWFLLPDEGVDVEELLTDSQVHELLFGGGNEWEDSKYLIVNQSIPKFDVSCQIDLIDGLKELGVTDVFDQTLSDFSPMTDDADGIYVSQASHAARVKADEEGVEAAAFTVIAAAGAAMPPEEEMDFVLDRPFLFAITGLDGAPLFVGVVNDPQG